jgi:hypothetical protein
MSFVVSVVTSSSLGNGCPLSFALASVANSALVASPSSASSLSRLSSAPVQLNAPAGALGASPPLGVLHSVEVRTTASGLRRYRRVSSGEAAALQTNAAVAIVTQSAISPTVRATRVVFVLEHP